MGLRKMTFYNKINYKKEAVSFLGFKAFGIYFKVIKTLIFVLAGLYHLYQLILIKKRK